MNDRHTISDLRQWQALPLTAKVTMTKARIRGWVDEYGIDGVYVAFSGGKDSTVLLDICRKMYPDMKAVFVDTGLEYPEIRDFVKTYDNIDWLKPDMNFRQVIKKYGYPMISKEVSETVYGARKYMKNLLTQANSSETVLTDRQTDRQTDTVCLSTRQTPRTRKISEAEVPIRVQQTMRTGQVCETRRGGGTTASIGDLEEYLNLVGWKKIPWRLAAVLGAITKENQRANPRTIPNKDLSAFSQMKYEFFLEAPFEIAPNCCSVMKKKPLHDYYRKTGRHSISAQMASESRLRTQQWLKSGCNGFDLKYPMSNPMAFWDSQDVLLYIRLNNLPIASAYGDILTTDEISGQTTLFPYDAEVQSKLFAPDREKLYTTGCSRTGCVFCGFGCHLEKPGEGRFERLKVTHPQLYKYLFDDGIYRYEISNTDGSEIDVRRVDRDKLERWVEQNEKNPRFRINKTYIPGSGLGYKHIIDWINEHNGKGRIIRY